MNGQGSKQASRARIGLSILAGVVAILGAAQGSASLPVPAVHAASGATP